MMRSGIEELANSYLLHLADGRKLADPELAEAETAFILWDWEGLALLAYQQYLEKGRGAFVGPRVSDDRESLTVAFDYTPGLDQAVTRMGGRRLASSLGSHIEHYHPELDFIVIWLRKDGTVRYEVFRSHRETGFRPPFDLYGGTDWNRPRPAN